MKKKLFIICMILGCMISMGMINLVWGNDHTYIPTRIVTDRSVTNETEGFEIYTNGDLFQSESQFNKLFKGGYLYIKDGKRTVSKKKYSPAGIYVVKIPKQKAGAVLNIFIRSRKAESTHIKVKVKDIKEITDKKYSSKMKSPEFKRSTVCSGGCVTGKKGMDVVIQTSSRIIKKIHFNKNGKKFVFWDPSFDSETIYIYAVKNKYRSKIQCVPIIYKTPDKK